MYVHHEPVCSLPPIYVTGYVIAQVSVPDSVSHRIAGEYKRSTFEMC